MRILFQGDSVTDAGRNYQDPTDLGPGYPATTAKLLEEAFPNASFEFSNRGISGNRTENLIARFQKDVLDLKPDLMTLLIGVNDSWHRCAPTCIDTTDEMFENNYRAILDSLAEAKIPVVIMEPFSLPAGRLPDFRMDELSKTEIIRKLAREYMEKGVVLDYIPLDGMMAAYTMKNGIASITDDGVHPNIPGRVWLGTVLADALKPIVGARL